MRPLTNPLQIARLALRDQGAWLFFVEIPTTSGGFYRLVRNSEHQDGNGVRWHAASIGVDLPPEDDSGSLGEMILSIPNVSQTPMALVETGGELLGQTVTCWVQTTTDLDTFDDAASWQHFITWVQADEQTLQCRGGHPALSQPVPSQIIDRGRFPGLRSVGSL
ncbi:MAG: hypothetical protein NCW75_05515 [Phycisphaera sp.]|nr:MAG: hypothetical protein NCW75_05515 [Phycisphaera sp.]